jgi:hypothetical protein
VFPRLPARFELERIEPRLPDGVNLKNHDEKLGQQKWAILTAAMQR